MKIRVVLDGVYPKAATPSTLAIELAPDNKALVTIGGDRVILVDRAELFVAATAVCGSIRPDPIVSVG